MRRKNSSRSERSHRAPRSRSLHFESLEDRRVLAPLVDIVFTVDASSSGDDQVVKNWLKDRLLADSSG